MCDCIKRRIQQEETFFKNANKKMVFSEPFYEFQLNDFFKGKKVYPVRKLITYRNVFGVETAFQCLCEDMSYWRTNLPKDVIDTIYQEIDLYTKYWYNHSCRCGKRLIRSFNDKDTLYISYSKENEEHIIRKIGGIETYPCICDSIDEEEYSDEDSTDESDEESEQEYY